MTTKMCTTLATLLLALPTLRADEAENKAAAAIKQMGGFTTNINRHGIRQPWIDIVGLGGRKTTDESLKQLAPIRNLADLHLNDTNVSDAGLKELAGFKVLTFLTIDGTHVTDAGMSELIRHDKLLELSIANTQVGDAGLEAIGKIPNLHKLVLTKTNITDAGLKHLAKMKRLEDLTLFNTSITAEGLKHLKSVKTLKEIRIENNRVNDAVIKTLRANGQLQFLHDFTFPRRSLETKVLRLEDMNVTDACILDLADFRGVRTVVTSGTHITETGIAQIKALWPNVKIAD